MTHSWTWNALLFFNMIFFVAGYVIQTPSQEVELTVPLIPLKDNSPTSKHYVEARVAALEKKIEYFTHDVVPYSCLEARDDYGLPTGKVFIRSNITQTVFEVYCDMDAEAGPWMLILSYAHNKANTADTISQSFSSFPTYKERSLGDSSVGHDDWGHTGPSLLAQFPIEALKFYCRSSQTSTVVNFMTSHQPGLDYVQIGAAADVNTSFKNMGSDYTLLSGHTAAMPAICSTGYTSDDSPLTNFPFYGASKHWGIGAGGIDRWECDDYYSYDGAASTVHLAWMQ